MAWADIPPELLHEAKRAIIQAEVSGDAEHPNRYQITRPVLADLQRRFSSRFPWARGVTMDQVRGDINLQEAVADAYLQVLANRVLPRPRWTPEDFMQAWYLPYGYRASGFSIANIPNARHRNVMANRLRNYRAAMSGGGQR